MPFQLSRLQSGGIPHTTVHVTPPTFFVVGYENLSQRFTHTQKVSLLIVFYPAQQDNCFTSLVKVWAQSFNPSTIVRYGNN
jgi:hypothetical protein